MRYEKKFSYRILIESMQEFLSEKKRLSEMFFKGNHRAIPDGIQERFYNGVLKLIFAVISLKLWRKF